MMWKVIGLCNLRAVETSPHVARCISWKYRRLCLLGVVGIGCHGKREKFDQLSIIIYIIRQPFFCSVFS